MTNKSKNTTQISNIRNEIVDVVTPKLGLPLGGCRAKRQRQAKDQ